MKRAANLTKELRNSNVQKIMDVLGISFMIISCFFVLHVWFVTLAVQVYDIFMKYLCFCLCVFLFSACFSDSRCLALAWFWKKYDSASTFIHHP